MPGSRQPATSFLNSTARAWACLCCCPMAFSCLGRLQRCRLPGPGGWIADNPPTEAGDFAFELMKRAHLAATIGRATGTANPQRFIRFPSANSMAQCTRPLFGWSRCCEPCI